MNPRVQHGLTVAVGTVGILVSAALLAVTIYLYTRSHNSDLARDQFLLVLQGGWPQYNSSLREAAAALFLTSSFWEGLWAFLRGRKLCEPRRKDTNFLTTSGVMVCLLACIVLSCISIAVDSSSLSNTRRQSQCPAAAMCHQGFYVATTAVCASGGALAVILGFCIGGDWWYERTSAHGKRPSLLVIYTSTLLLGCVGVTLLVMTEVRKRPVEGVLIGGKMYPNPVDGSPLDVVFDYSNGDIGSWPQGNSILRFVVCGLALLLYPACVIWACVHARQSNDHGDSILDNASRVVFVVSHWIVLAGAVAILILDGYRYSNRACDPGKSCLHDAFGAVVGLDATLACILALGAFYGTHSVYKIHVQDEFKRKQTASKERAELREEMKRFHERSSTRGLNTFEGTQTFTLKTPTSSRQAPQFFIHPGLFEQRTRAKETKTLEVQVGNGDIRGDDCDNPTFPHVEPELRDDLHPGPGDDPAGDTEPPEVLDGNIFIPPPPLLTAEMIPPMQDEESSDEGEGSFASPLNDNIVINIPETQEIPIIEEEKPIPLLEPSNMKVAATGNWPCIFCGTVMEESALIVHVRSCARKPIEDPEYPTHSQISMARSTELSSLAEEVVHRWNEFDSLADSPQGRIDMQDSCNVCCTNCGQYVPLTLFHRHQDECNKVFWPYVGVILEDRALGSHSPTVANPTITVPLITRVVLGSPADEAGLRGGDVVKMFNGVPIEAKAEFGVALSQTTLDSIAPIVIIRDGVRLAMSVAVKKVPYKASKHGRASRRLHAYYKESIGKNGVPNGIQTNSL